VTIQVKAILNDTHALLQAGQAADVGDVAFAFIPTLS